VLLVEHKVDLVTSISDTITVLESGRVLAAGTPREVVASQAVIDAYLGSSAPIEASTDDIAEGVGSVV
jgi:ABC-type branched-subunit amino acid transport system ATPase component